MQKDQIARVVACLQVGVRVHAFSLAHDDEQALAQIGSIAGRAAVELAFADLHQRGAVAERKQQAFVDDADVVVAAHGAAMRPFLQR